MSSIWSTFPLVREGLERVKSRLRAQTELLPAELREEWSPLLQREGKSLRAGLILLSAGVTKAEHRDAVDAAAAAVELLHLATLIHDDIVDQAAFRRGEPALHQRLGSPKAVLYGDLLFAAAFRSVSQDVGPESSRALADLVITMAVAEIQQLNDRYQPPGSLRRILRKTMGKTALLFSLSVYVGAKEAGRSETFARLLRRAGYSLGMAFQLQDDLLDWMGDPQVLGKPVYEDVTSGIYTWPVALAWRDRPDQTLQELMAVRQGNLAPRVLRDQWAERGYWSETEALVQRYASRAGRDLDLALGSGTSERKDWSRFVAALLARRF